MDKSFTKGLKLIETLANSEDPRGITSLAKELELTKSNVHRILATLQVQGYVRQVEVNGAYALTSKLWELGALVMSRLDLSRVAQEPMAALASKTSESVHLSILDGHEVIYIHKIESLHAVRAYSRIGGRAPAWCVATGKALLAHAPPELVEPLLPLLSAFTSATLAEPEALRRDLERARAQGFAINRGEWRADVCGVAAPVRDSSSRVVAAIGISGPAIRLKPAQLKGYGPEVVQAADAISGALGYRLGT
jgi:DNA-binding IclR family transcriptional regulator